MHLANIFESDERKAAEILRKHKVSFGTAKTIFRDPRLLLRRDLSSDDEERLQAISQAIDSSVLLVAHTVRYEHEATTRIRLISARHADKRERDAYRSGQN